MRIYRDINSRFIMQIPPTYLVLDFSPTILIQSFAFTIYVSSYFLIYFTYGDFLAVGAFLGTASIIKLEGRVLVPWSFFVVSIVTLGCANKKQIK